MAGMADWAGAGSWVFWAVNDGKWGLCEQRWKWLGRWWWRGEMGGVWGQIWTQCLRMGEQLDRGAATLPTLSSLSRINDGVRLRACVEPTRTCTCSRPLTHTHTLTHGQVCLIYIDILGPSVPHLSWTMWRGGSIAFGFQTRGQHVNGRRPESPWSPLLYSRPSPPSPVTTVSNFKWSGQMLNQCF